MPAAHPRRSSCRGAVRLLLRYLPRNSATTKLHEQDPVANSVAKLVGKTQSVADFMTTKLLMYLGFTERLAGEPGLEPRLTESESAVLPLNYSPAWPY